MKKTNRIGSNFSDRLMAQKWYQTKDAKIAFVGSATLIICSLIGLFGVCSGNKQAPTVVNQYSTSQLSANADTSSAREPSGPSTTGKDSMSKPISRQQPSDVDRTKERETPQTQSALISPSEPEPVAYYQIKVHVSSKMKDASFFVDNEPAQIIDDLTTVKVIRVRKKDSNHTISVKKDSVECSKQLFITQNNVVVTLCP